MPIAPPTLDDLPATPDRADRATFSARCTALFDQLKNSSIAQWRAAMANVYANAVEAYNNALVAAASQGIAQAAANFRGSWAALTGSISVPSSVYHSSKYWMLLQNLANVTTQTPGSAPTYWVEINPLAGNSTGGINFLKGADVASAATPDIWAPALGNVIGITGATTTTGFSTAPQAGASRWLRATGAWPLTHGANLILPGSVNYTCAAGDLLHVVALTTTQFQVTIFKVDGLPVTRRGLVPISSATASSSASVAFTSGIDSTYDEYVVVLVNVVSASNSILRLRTSTDSGSSYATTSGDYYVLMNYQSVSSATPTGYSSATDTHMSIHGGNVDNTASQGGISGEVRFFNPSSTSAKKHFSGQTISANGSSSDYNQTTFAGVRASTAAINAIQFSMATGNIASGLFMLFGVKK